jgi:hypothetical protein
MVGTGQTWKGYRNVYPATDINGPILSGSQPLTQSTGAALVDYDIWVDTSVNASEYPAIYRYQASTASFILINNTDHSSPAGIIFADARFTADGTPSGSEAGAAMVTSNYLDNDAPNAELYPAGLLLYNTRYSTNNVKQWNSNYFPGTTYPGRWVTASGNQPNGVPYSGYAAQRNIVVEALNAVIASNEAIRAEQNYFNLIVTPGYPECIDEMIQLNEDIKQVAFVIGDTPSRLPADGTSIQNWATNAANAPSTGTAGLTISDSYTALYYPWGLGTNIDGNTVFVPPSVIGLMTIAYNDQVAYPWFAPAGYTRGVVSVVSSVGYLDATNGDTFVPVQLNQGQRDVLYTNLINPIAYIPNRGLIVYGQITLDGGADALNRINVARLINYLNYNLDLIGKPFLFQQNNSQTQAAAASTYISFMNNLVSLQALYDFGVLCDESNNTPTTIDLNQLIIDIAIQPQKDIEFIYIPVALLNTGDSIPAGYQSGNSVTP